jgi:hypothetical protein
LHNDAVKGRLWVVCKQCERWNLTPLDERWEAIEQAERQFSAAKQRVSTENIGLTRLNDGTELVRIGEPLRPEYAAWRYGDQFGRRRQLERAWRDAEEIAAISDDILTPSPIQSALDRLRRLTKE